MYTPCLRYTQYMKFMTRISGKHLKSHMACKLFAKESKTPGKCRRHWLAKGWNCCFDCTKDNSFGWSKSRNLPNKYCMKDMIDWTWQNCYWGIKYTNFLQYGRLDSYSYIWSIDHWHKKTLEHTLNKIESNPFFHRSWWIHLRQLKMIRTLKAARTPNLAQ